MKITKEEKQKLREEGILIDSLIRVANKCKELELDNSIQDKLQNMVDDTKKVFIKSQGGKK